MRSSNFARFPGGFVLFGYAAACALAASLIGAACASCANGTDDDPIGSGSDAGANDFLMPVTDADPAARGDGIDASGSASGNEGDDGATGDDDGTGDADADAAPPSGGGGTTRDASSDATTASPDGATNPDAPDAAGTTDAATDASKAPPGPDGGSECGAAGSYAAQGTACTDNGGVVCDGAGACTQTFTVVRVGDGVTALSSAAAPVHLDTFYPSAGASASTTDLPIAAPDAGSNQPFTVAGSSTSEGNVTTSANGKYVTLEGYAALPGTASVAGTAAATVPRVVARVAAAGSSAAALVDTSTTLGSAVYSRDNVRSAATSDGSAFWVTGSSGGMYTVGFGASGGGTSVASTPSNMRFDGIFGGQLYCSSGMAGSTSIQSVGTGVSASSGQAATNLVGVTTSNPYGFVFFDRDSAVAGLDTLYIADATSGLERWTFDGTTWTRDSSFAGITSAVFGVTGWPTAYGVVVLVTTGNAIERVDIPTATPDDATVTLLQTAGTDMAYRGITLAPH